MESPFPAWFPVDPRSLASAPDDRQLLRPTAFGAWAALYDGDLMWSSLVTGVPQLAPNVDSLVSGDAMRAVALATPGATEAACTRSPITRAAADIALRALSLATMALCGESTSPLTVVAAIPAEALDALASRFGSRTQRERATETVLAAEPQLRRAILLWTAGGQRVRLRAPSKQARTVSISGYATVVREAAVLGFLVGRLGASLWRLHELRRTIALPGCGGAAADPSSR